MAQHNYVILVEGPTKSGNYGAWCPDVPGCVATGATYDDTVALMHEALEFHLEGLDQAPESSGRPEVVTV